MEVVSRRVSSMPSKMESRTGHEGTFVIYHVEHEIIDDHWRPQIRCSSLWRGSLRNSCWYPLLRVVLLFRSSFPLIGATLSDLLFQDKFSERVKSELYPDQAHLCTKCCAFQGQNALVRHHQRPTKGMTPEQAPKATAVGIVPLQRQVRGVFAFAQFRRNAWLAGRNGALLGTLLPTANMFPLLSVFDHFSRW